MEPYVKVERSGFSAALASGKTVLIMD